MKNDSFLFSFSVPGDSIFDSNNDGKLTGYETAFRDAAIMTASAIRNGNSAIFGIGGLAIGLIAGALGTGFIKKKKKTQA